MSDKERIQININLSAGQMEQLRTLTVHYGSISAAVRVAIDALWREYVRGSELAGSEGNAIHEDGDAGRPSV